MTWMTLAPLARRAPRALVRLPALASKRTHYTGTPHDHGGRAGGELRTGMNPGVGQGSAPGPRAPLALGLDTARAVTNLGRALETHAEASVSAFADMFESVWHADGLLFRRGDGDAAGWAASTAAEELASVRARRALPVATPALLSLAFADERTALVRLLGADGRERFLSMLRLDGAMMHDGWQIVREVVGSPLAAAPTTPAADDAPLASVRALLRSYLAIEHGGGAAHRKQAEALFAPRASLLAVGSAAADAPPSVWEAPAGAMLEVPLATYLDGVASQTPHAAESATHDAIVNVELLPCGTAAAATVHVGNGACTTVFHDHLLLGRTGGRWRILSKTFAPRPWP